MCLGVCHGAFVSWCFSAWCVSGSVLALDQRYVKRVFVSDRCRDKGIYTLKFFKQGQVRVF